MYYFIGKQEFTIEELGEYVKSPRVNPERLEQAARLPIAGVRAAVAANPSTQAKALSFLAKDPSEEVRIAAAKHQNISLMRCGYWPTTHPGPFCWGLQITPGRARKLWISCREKATGKLEWLLFTTARPARYFSGGSVLTGISPFGWPQTRGVGTKCCTCSIA